MAVFSYRAVQADGEAVSGSLDADSARAARQRLRALGLFVTEVRQVPTDDTAPGGRVNLLRRDRRPAALWFARELHLLLLTGMSLPDALGSLARNAPRGLRTVVRALRDDVSKGESLASSLERHGAWFDTLYVSMVLAGERSGELAHMLGALVGYLEQRGRFRQQVRTALVYPKIVALAAFGVVVFLMSTVVPEFVNVLLRRGGRLPLPTAALKWLSDYCAVGWPWLLMAAFLAAAAYQLAMRQERWRLGWERLMLALPVFGAMRRKRAAQQFAVMLGALLRGGMPLTEALAQVERTNESAVVAAEAGRMRQRLQEGGELEADDGVFPGSFADMLAAGQESGSLEQVLLTAAEVYAGEVEAHARRVAALVEPLAIVAVALVVGFIVAAVLLPVFELGQLQ